jgi:hypothetical protein
MGIWAEPKGDILPNLSPIDYLLGRMRDPRTEEHVKTRIAIALLPFTTPKLAVQANIDSKDFGLLLEKAKARIEKAEDQSKTIEAKREVEPVTAKPILPVPDRRFRR